MQGRRQWLCPRALQIIDPNKYISVALLACKVFDFEPSLPTPFCGVHGGLNGQMQNRQFAKGNVPVNYLIKSMQSICLTREQ